MSSRIFLVQYLPVMRTLPMQQQHRGSGEAARELTAYVSLIRSSLSALILHHTLTLFLMQMLPALSTTAHPEKETEIRKTSDFSLPLGEERGT